MNEGEAARKVLLLTLVAAVGLLVASWAEGAAGHRSLDVCGKTAFYTNDGRAEGLLGPVSCALAGLHGD